MAYSRDLPKMVWQQCGIIRVVAGKIKVFSIPSWKYNFNQESTNLWKFQYTLGPKVYNSDFPKFGYL